MGSGLTSKLANPTPVDLVHALKEFDWNKFFATASLDDLELFWRVRRQSAR